MSELFYILYFCDYHYYRNHPGIIVLIKSVHIRKLYKPIQPTVKQSAENVSYAEFLPHSGVQSFIYCYWQLKTNKALSEQFKYRVVADGCIDFYFDLANPDDSYVMGFCKKFTEFPLENYFNYIGVRFLPTMFPQLFKVNAKQLSNRFEHLSNVIPATARFIKENLNGDPDSEMITGIFDAYFLKLISNTGFNNDSRLYEAIEIILNNYGVIDIENGLNTGISPRQLRRIFEYYIGDTAKSFSKIVRFQNILKAKPSIQNLRQNKLFYGAGYYDQAHFIKEFRNFYGETPGKALGR